MIELPVIAPETSMPFAALLRSRCSTRRYGAGPLLLAEVGQLVWAAQGISRAGARRTAPSAGALYPLEIYVACTEVRDLSPGLYHYHPAEHGLRRQVACDLRQELGAVALHQGAVGRAPVTLVIAADYARTAAKYGARARRYVHMEVGHAGQNVYLQAADLGLGTVVIGAFDDERLQRLLGLTDHEVVALMPVGRLP